jgi:hypothetical protein
MPYFAARLANRQQRSFLFDLGRLQFGGFLCWFCCGHVILPYFLRILVPPVRATQMKFHRDYAFKRAAPERPSCLAFNLDLPRFGLVGPRYLLSRPADRPNYRRSYQLLLDALQRSLLFEFLGAEFLCHFCFLQFCVFLTTQTCNAITSPNVRGIVNALALFANLYKEGG